MRYLLQLLLLISCLSTIPNVLRANEISYYSFQPDIITNYVNSQDGKTLGYIRVAVELMVANKKDLALVEYHAPLLRHTLIEMLGKQDISSIRSLEGKEKIRILCLNALNDILVQESGKKAAKDLLFTRYFYQ